MVFQDLVHGLSRPFTVAYIASSFNLNSCGQVEKSQAELPQRLLTPFTLRGPCPLVRAIPFFALRMASVFAYAARFLPAVLRSVIAIYFVGAQPLSHGPQGDKSHSITQNLTGQFKEIGRAHV